MWIFKSHEKQIADFETEEAALEILRASNIELFEKKAAALEIKREKLLKELEKEIEKDASVLQKEADLLQKAKQRLQRARQRLDKSKNNFEGSEELGDFLNATIAENYSHSILSRLPFLSKIINEERLVSFIEGIIQIITFTSFSGRIRLFRSLVYCTYTLILYHFIKRTYFQHINVGRPITFPYLLVAFIAIVFIRNVQKRLKYYVLYKKNEQKLNYTELKLVSLTKSRIHNIRNNYNSINALVVSKQYSTLALFVENSAFYYSYSLNNWDKKFWTIEDERTLMHAYLDCEKALGKNITVKENYDNIDITKTLFLPEVFSTLLHNSILHAFKEVKQDAIFEIEIVIKGKLLMITISDNGIPSHISAYIQANKPHKGLSLLERRLNNEINIYALSNRNPYVELEIIPIENKGTTIKFAFPYATTT